MKIVCCIFAVLFTYLWCHFACNDKDFYINNKPLSITKNEKIFIVISVLLLMYLILNMPVTFADRTGYSAVIFATLSMPYLIVSAITDKKTKLVYNSPFYIFGAIAVVMESIVFQHFRFSVIVIYLFAQLLATMKLYGAGDRAMTVICGTIYFFINPEVTVIEALLVNCIMIIIAEIIFYIQAVMERNLENPFKLKESRPLGPVLCAATFITLIGVNLI